MVYLLPLRRAWFGALLLFLVGFIGLSLPSQASHIRAGEIQAKIDTTVNYNPNRVFFRLTLYCSEPIMGRIPDQENASIFFGDGSCAKIPRTTNISVKQGIRRYTYDFEHTYGAASPAGRPYVVSFVGENRNLGVLNMRDSGSQSFYVSTTVTIDPALLQNRSPVLRYPAIDNAVVAQVFQHNPAAYDADGDSLAYELVNSQQGGVLDVITNCTPVFGTVPGYVKPNGIGAGLQVPFSGPPVGRAGERAIFRIDSLSGQVVWNAPAQTGEYNFAIAVKEYRRVLVSGRRLYRQISTVIRDIQITVRASDNKLPELTIPADICVVAGTPLVGNVRATDPDGNRIRLAASSGILPPATFTQSSFGPPTATGTFNWTPDCNNIAAAPILVVFSAVDEPDGVNTIPLTDIRTWRITVIGPAPQNLRAVAVSGPNNARNTRLTWNSYICRKPGARVLIYRREESNGADFGECVTGIPASSGYVQIAALTYTSNTDIVDYTDTNSGQGLERGKTYCYRIYVAFPLPAGGASLASQEACVKFPGRALLMRNVTVDRTATSNGQITVRWTKPRNTPAFADPQQFRVLRAISGTPNFAQVGPLIAVTNNTNDTTYVDEDLLLDTQNRSYTYRVEFLSQGVVTETATAASSVRLEGTATPAVSTTDLNTIDLRWTYNVPWDNARRPTIIYRRGPDPSSSFVRIGTVTSTATSGSYRDQGTATQRLIKGQTYCYYVETNGTYNAPRTLPDSLINLSQQQCIAVRNVPCAPVLRLQQPNCDSLASRLFDLPATPLSGPVYTNRLSWQLGNTPADCSREIVSYKVYYARTTEDSLTIIDTVPATQTSYEHRNLPSEAGCYAVQAVDSSGTLSALSNRACKADCQLFLLPNIFTPNGDGKNDTFRPKVFTPLRRTHFTVFNRWGVKIYESSSDPLINWSGGSSRSEGGASPSAVEGVYYYQAEVEFGDVANTKRTYKGWVQITR